MTTILIGIIEKLEAAPGPDRELDYQIALAVEYDYGRDWLSFRAHQAAHGYLTAFIAHRPWLDAHTPKYTASFEDALTLMMPGKGYELAVYGSGTDGATFTCAAFKWWPRPDDIKGWRSESGNKLSASMALCIAALRVRQAFAEETAAPIGLENSTSG